MKIAFNGCNYNDQPSGAKNRFIGLTSSLFKLFPDNEYTIYEPSDADLKTNFIKYDNIIFIKTPLDSRNTFQRYIRGLSYWKNEFKKNKYSIFDHTYLPAVYNLSTDGKTIFTIHDLRYIIYPELFSIPRRIFSSYITRKALLKSDMIITISITMKKQILDFEPRAKVEVIENGLPINFPKIEEIKECIPEIKRKYNLPNEFLLSVGHLEKRKNFLGLIKAYDLNRQKGLDLPLYIIGSPADASDELIKLVREKKLEKKVRFLHTISSKDLSGFYFLCSLFIFPSFYEGFGIPLLEAMHYSKPFICSNIDVFKEITSGKGIYFNPNDKEDIADKIQYSLNNNQVKESFRSLSEERLAYYNWDNIAKRYWGMIQQ